MKKSSTGLVLGDASASGGISGSNTLGLGASAGVRAGRDDDLVCDVVPPVSPARTGLILVCAVGGRYSGAGPVGCLVCETTVGVVVVVDGWEESAAEVEGEVEVEVEVPASLLPVIGPSSGTDV
jgi:hypothetical protein